jgi:HSP20 family molecular chaperone IbpA
MKSSIMKKFITGLFCTLLALPVMAQEDELKDLPGYVDFGDLSATYGEPKITINLGGTMLNFVSMMSSAESPETSELISKLKGIRVQIYSTDKDAGAAKKQFGKTKKGLKSSGWEPIVQINEDDEQVLVYMKMDGGNMEGMTVMVVDDEEAVFVNIIGQLNPAELGKVMESFDVNVDLDLD